jgi:hypothetical protein
VSHCSRIGQTLILELESLETIEDVKSMSTAAVAVSSGVRAESREPHIVVSMSVKAFSHTGTSAFSFFVALHTWTAGVIATGFDYTALCPSPNACG